MPTLTASISSKTSDRYQDDLGQYVIPAIDFGRSFQAGTGANQANLLYLAHGTIASNASPDVLDLTDGSMIGWGQTSANQPLVFAEVASIAVKNLDATNAITLGGATNALAGLFGNVADTVVIPPGGTFIFSAPGDPALAVTASTADELKLAVSAGTDVAYAIRILGRSA